MNEVLFKDLDLSQDIVKAVEDMGYSTATQIQAMAIPLLMNGKDVIGLSGTGTGKTAAFGIPVVEKMSEEDIGKVKVLVLCPTRELAMQISDEIRKFAKYKKAVRIATVYGGQAFNLQIQQLRSANVVIGTPGRIMDHIERRTLRLGELNTVILDEADEMLNMGFLEDIQFILSKAPEERQTILFSATMSPAILKVTSEFQTYPEVIKIEKDKAALNNIAQFYYEVPQGRKMDIINLILQRHRPNRSIIFCNTKKMVDDLVIYLNENGFKSEGLHGDMKQMQRTSVMNSYKHGRVQILVATDVAARGIDVDDIEAVINFDIPQENEYYIHRIGRTARAGKTGSSYTLTCNNTQIRKILEIQRHVGSKIVFAEIPTKEEIIKEGQNEFVDKIKKVLDGAENTDNDYIIDSLTEQGYDMSTIASALVTALVGKETKSIPIVSPMEKKRSPRPVRTESTVTLRVDIGRTQRIAPNFIVGAIVEDAHVPAKRIGKIDIFNDYTTIELDREDAASVVKHMEGRKIKGHSVTFNVVAGTSDRQYRPNDNRRRSYGGNSGGYRGNAGNSGNPSNRYSNNRNRTASKPENRND